MNYLVFSVCGTLQIVFGIWRLRRDPYFLLAPAEGGISLQGLSAVKQTGLSAPAASEGDLLPSRSSGCCSGWDPVYQCNLCELFDVTIFESS